MSGTGVKAYSLSSQEGDCLLDSEDLDGLFAALVEGAGLAAAIVVSSALRHGDEQAARDLVRELGAVLSIEETPLDE